jgi:hypothetical protein
MKSYMSLLLVSLLSGCVANGIPIGVSKDAPDGVSDNTMKKFIGIPSVIAIEGSAAKLDENWIITVAHNRPMLPKDTVYHPKCDIALYKQRTNLKTLKEGLVYKNRNVYHIGYPSVQIPLPETVQKGVYKGDVIDPSDGCIYSATTATIASGMSGGGVVNQKGELIGVTRGIMYGEIKWEDGTIVNSPAIFVPLYRFRDWIKSVTGVDYYEN